MSTATIDPSGHGENAVSALPSSPSDSTAHDRVPPWKPDGWQVGCPTIKANCPCGSSRFNAVDFDMATLHARCCCCNRAEKFYPEDLGPRFVQIHEDLVDQECEALQGCPA